MRRARGIWGTLSSPSTHKTITAVAALSTVFVGLKSHNDSNVNKDITAAAYGSTQLQVVEMTQRIDSLMVMLKKHERQDRARFKGKPVAYGPEIAPPGWVEPKKPGAVRRLFGWLTSPLSGG